MYHRMLLAEQKLRLDFLKKMKLFQILTVGWVCKFVLRFSWVVKWKISNFLPSPSSNIDWFRTGGVDLDAGEPRGLRRDGVTGVLEPEESEVSILTVTVVAVSGLTGDGSRIVPEDSLSGEMSGTISRDSFWFSSSDFSISSLGAVFSSELMMLVRRAVIGNPTVEVISSKLLV